MAVLEATRWTGAAATANRGRPADVTGSLTLSDGSTGVSGAHASLYVCETATSCPSTTPLATGTTVRPGGGITLTSPVVAALPAHFQLRRPGNAHYAPATSPVPTLNRS